MKRNYRCVGGMVLGALLTLMGGCGGGGASLVAPTIASVLAELVRNNAQGMVPEKTLGAITLPACTVTGGAAPDYAVTYAITGLPTWLTFDAATRALALSGVTEVPQEGLAALPVTYTCTATSDSSNHAQLEFTVNDADNGGVTDGNEFVNGAVPLVGFHQAIDLTPDILSLYRIGTTSFLIPTNITKATTGMNPQDAADDTADFDGDAAVSGGGTNAVEIAAGTDPFIAASTGQFGAFTNMAGMLQAPYGMISADFNQDGFLDVATANMGFFGGNSVSIFMGNGDGTFDAEVSYTVGNSPQAIVAADMNGDGVLDLAVTNGTSDTISVLIGNSDGTFKTKVDYPAADNPRGIAAADVTGDGIVDLVTTDNGGALGNTVSLYTGNGDGTFQARTSFTVGTGPGSLVIADVNNDGILDIVSTSYGKFSAATGTTIQVLLGQGSGAFAAAVSYTVGTGPGVNVVADFNEDGNLDIATANNGASNVSVIVGNGDGTFGTHTEYAVGERPADMAVGDINGDGHMDIVVSNFNAGGADADGKTVSVLLGVGDGTFAAQQTYDVLTIAAGPVGVVLADLDNDGSLDLVVANYWDSSLSILMNQ